MKLHLRDDMDISKYRLNKFVDKLVDKAVDKINNDLDCKDLEVVAFRYPADNTIVCIDASVNHTERTNAVHYITNNLERVDREFYIWVKQNKYDKQTYIHSGCGSGKQYATYFDDLDKLESYVMDELVPTVVDNVNKTYRDYVAKYGEPIKESYTPDKYDIERVAELVKFCLYDRGFESKYKVYSKDFTIRMWYKYETEPYDRTVYLDDIDWNWSEEKFEYWAKNKAEELAGDYFEYID